jgi:hypothetical protein
MAPKPEWGVNCLEMRSTARGPGSKRTHHFGFGNRGKNICAKVDNEVNFIEDTKRDVVSVILEEYGNSRSMAGEEL